MDNYGYYIVSYSMERDTAMILGKRFSFGIIAIICVSATTIIRLFDADTYFKLITAIVGVYITSQTVTDHNKKGVKDV